MNVGVTIGLIGALGGLLAIRYSPPLRPIRIVERVAPYLGESPPPSRLLSRPLASSPSFLVIRRLCGPTLTEVGSRFSRVFGGDASVRRRLRGLALDASVDEFRIEQLVWGAQGVAAGASISAVITGAAGRVAPIAVVVTGISTGICGVLGRDIVLTQALRRRERAILDELPVVADLLAIAVVAGESPAAALSRIGRLTRGALATELAIALSPSGAQMTVALIELGKRTTVAPLARFVSAVAVALDRGTPLAGVLRAQAADIRQAARRNLMESGSRREIAMMLPVVFLILPVTVVFAMYPGLMTLTSLVQG